MKEYLYLSFNLVNFFKPTHGIDAIKFLKNKGIDFHGIFYETVQLLETKNGDVLDYYVAMILSTSMEIKDIMKDFMAKYAKVLSEQGDFDDAFDRLDYNIPRVIEDFFNGSYSIEHIDKGIDLYMISTTLEDMKRFVLAHQLTM